MSDINVITMAGHITNEPGVNSCSNGGKIFKTRIASNIRFKSGGEDREFTTYVNVDAFNYLAQRCIDMNLSKGDKILVHGQLRLNEWRDKESGDKRSDLYIRAREISVIPKVLSNRKTEDTKSSDSATVTRPPQVPDTVDTGEGDDDIPF